MPAPKHPPSPTTSKPPAPSTPHRRLAPRRTLFRVLLVLFLLWMAAVWAMWWRL